MAFTRDSEHTHSTCKIQLAPKGWAHKSQARHWEQSRKRSIRFATQCCLERRTIPLKRQGKMQLNGYRRIRISRISMLNRNQHNADNSFRVFSPRRVRAAISKDTENDALRRRVRRTAKRGCLFSCARRLREKSFLKKQLTKAVQQPAKGLRR